MCLVVCWVCVDDVDCDGFCWGLWFGFVVFDVVCYGVVVGGDFVGYYCVVVY